MASVSILEYFSMKDSFYTDRSETLFCSPAWVRVLYRTYGFKCYAAIDDENDICIPFVLIDNLMGKKLTTLPFSDYTDINTDTPEKYETLIAKITAEFPDVPLVLKTIGKKGKPDTSVWGDAIRTAYYHRIDTRTETELSKTQSSSFKRNVNKAKKTGISVEIKRDSIALSDFYRLYADLRMNKFNSIPQPFPFFERVFDEFIAKENGFIVEAALEGKAIASIVVLQYKNVLYYKFGASDEEHLNLRPNNLLFDKLIHYAVQNGFEAIDLGLSGTGDAYKGLVRFKESMGGVAHDIVYYQKQKNGQEMKNEALGQWLIGLTDEIVATKPPLETLSQLSSHIYPLFA